MDPRVRKHAGVEIKPIQQHLPRHILESSFKQGASFVKWNRLFMGMRPSPYNAVRHYYWGEEFARGTERYLRIPWATTRSVSTSREWGGMILHSPK